MRLAPRTFRGSDRTRRRHCCVGRSQRAEDVVGLVSVRWLRFPRKVISVAARWYLRYGLSYRDGEELPAERGATIDHLTIYRWVQRATPEFIEAACRHTAPTLRSLSG